jgi:hypothetical protein
VAAVLEEMETEGMVTTSHEQQVKLRSHYLASLPNGVIKAVLRKLFKLTHHNLTRKN